MSSQQSAVSSQKGGGAESKVALVTESGRGLGRAMALGLSRAAFRVAITAARNRSELEAVAQEASSGQIYPTLIGGGV